MSADTKSIPASVALPAHNDERARQIIEAAYALIGHSGLEGLTIRAVLTRTGLARRAFYERFAGKDDLVLAVFAHVIGLAADHYTQEIGRLATPLDRLQFVIHAIALGSTANDASEAELNNRLRVAMSQEHLRLANARPADLQMALSPLLILIEQLLADGMACGVVRNSSPKQLATLIYNLVATTIHAEFLSQEDGGADHKRRQTLARDIWEFCQFGIAVHHADA